MPPSRRTIIKCRKFSTYVSVSNIKVTFFCQFSYNRSITYFQFQFLLLVCFYYWLLIVYFRFVPGIKQELFFIQLMLMTYTKALQGSCWFRIRVICGGDHKAVEFISNKQIHIQTLKFIISTDTVHQIKYCIVDKKWNDSTHKLNVVHAVISPQRKHNIIWKKRLEETQTLRAGCSKVKPKISPHHRPPYRGCGMAKI